MYQVKVTYKGIAPLLINAFSDEKAGRKSDVDYMAEALRKLHRTDDGECCITAEMIKSCLVAGSSMSVLKLGRKSLVQYLKATVFVEPRQVTLGKKKPDFIDKRMGRIPPGPRGAAVMLYRPGFKEGWQISFKFVVSDDRVTLGLLKQAADDSGLLVGLGSGRPDFGRFVITQWEVSDGQRPQ